MQSKTDAVNYLLDVLGSPPVGDLETLHPDLSTCLNKLNDSSLLLQSPGFWYNREISVLHKPDENGEIDIPYSILKVLAIYEQFAVQRGVKLYDTVNNTYKFEQDITLDLIRHLDWDYLPTSVQNAIKYHAAMQVATIDLEDSQKGQDQEKLYMFAYAQVKAEELELTRRNVLTSPAATLHRSLTNRGRHSAVYNPVIPGGGR